ncbi:MAG: iron-siderophore ABC transporter substrate-binding protein [Nocardioides sp.]|uniref:iron-siderophore ABC transporter substrate-binding protein n=1 Tax=Nocardioides sp. TaxID=35761 RepID=UPI0039E26ED0
MPPRRSGAVDRRTLLGGAAGIGLAGLLAACGSSGEASDGSSSASSGGAFPATITHKYGSTRVTQAPQRVVVVGVIEQDALLALGVVPVATTKWFGEPGEIFPWAKDALGDADLPTVLDADDGIDVEKVASLSPDLIIGVYSGMTQKEYKLLSALAPTVAQPQDYVDYGTPWDVCLTMVGEAVGKPDEADALLTKTKSRISDAAADNPDFAGQSAVVVTPYEGLWVYGPEDLRGRLLADLGFSFPDSVSNPDADEFGWSLSEEQASKLADVGVVVWFDGDKMSKGMSAVWRQTDTYTEGRWFDLRSSDGYLYQAMSFLTPLSIPYVLKRYLPKLAAAADGDPATKVPSTTS